MRLIYEHPLVVAFVVSLIGLAIGAAPLLARPKDAK